ncbi:MAG: hypothetical protein HY288_16230 [Planctomycetia bacterium]|nr:hypothetical protein [Planctomycetia bacterium]
MLRVLWFPLSLLVCAATWPCIAQDSPDLRRDFVSRIAPSQESSPGVLTPTPEMWFYEQERIRHDDPKLTIRRRAELRGLQRQDRLASLKWFGLSNSRPTVSITPWFGSYSANWGSNTADPMRWRPAAAPVIVQRPTDRAY